MRGVHNPQSLSKVRNLRPFCSRRTENRSSAASLRGLGFLIMPFMQGTYDGLIEKLKPLRRVLITTHVRPDGDALGTAGAMHLGLKQRGIDSEILLLSHLPGKYAF